MECGKRKRRRRRNRHRPSIADLELEERKDIDQNHIGDLPMKETKGLNDKAIVGGDSDEGRDPSSAYLVACHWDWSSSSKPYSVYKMVDLAPSDASSPSSSGQKRLKLLRRLETKPDGKMFTSVRSRHRAWIVGVGGTQGDTVIFDTKKNKVIHGPNLNSAKWRPVLMAVGDKVYAMSRSPSWVLEPDFPPWFEVLDLSQAKVVTAAGRSYLEGCSWIDLLNPPCIPWALTPTDYTMLPTVILVSYVVVANYILVSFNKQWGTYALDTRANEPEWHKVDDRRLPFFGCATQHGSIFLGLSQKDGPISAYRIHIAPSDKGNALRLSIAVLPVKYMEHEVHAGPCFSSLDNKCFCSLSLSLDSHSFTLNPDSRELFPRKVHVNLTTYQIEDPSLVVNPEEALLDVKPDIAVSSQSEQALKIASSKHGFSPFAFAFLSI
uniref:Uncharacterized protein n=1 Tax=Arundo donax TaxID=35708 RepID=A0A0A9CSY8_ARUDO